MADTGKIITDAWAEWVKYRATETSTHSGAGIIVALIPLFQKSIDSYGAGDNYGAIIYGTAGIFAVALAIKSIITPEVQNGR
ncbi:MAG: hypothetical protein WC856_08005 [Methylococcaceae bacterium]|jgi:hypothetical protein